MAIEPDEEDREDLIIEDPEADEPEPDDAAADAGEADEPDEGEPPEDDDEIEISFGDGEAVAKPEDSAPIRALREENRRQARELADLRKAAAPPPITLGPRPTLESCGYEEDEYAAATEKWIADKAKADEVQKQRQQAQTQAQADWNEELAGFERKKAALKVRNFDVAEEAVLSGLSREQQAIIIQAADDSAKVIYALGLHPQKLADLGKLTNLVKFTAAVVKLEGSLKVTTKKQAPTPDRPVRGSAPFTASNGKTDAHLEKLERTAAKTGDRTPIIAYRRSLKAKAASK